MLQISFFSTAFTGGAGIAAKRLFDGLQTYPAEFQFYSLKNFSPQKSRGGAAWLQKVKTSLYYRNIEKNLAGRPEGLEIFSPATLQHKTPFFIEKLVGEGRGINDTNTNKNKNILHLHWINDLIDFPSFFDSIPDSTPIIWTLHDFNTFTGGCHYPNACRNFETNCTNCPQLGTEGKVNYAYQNQQLKAKLLKMKNLHIVTPSLWLQKEAEKSSILANAKSFQTISNGIDLESYQPINREECRKVLGIETTDFVLAFGAEKLDTSRKGLQYLWEAIEILIAKNIKFTLLVFGKNLIIPENLANKISNNTTNKINDNLKICYVGEVNHSRLQRIIYSATDVFVIPSLEDNQPLTCIESMSCGTPVVAFRAGGLPEMVIDNETGFTAKLGNSFDLAEKITYLYQNTLLTKKMGEQARKFAAQQFGITKQAQVYWELYQKVI